MSDPVHKEARFSIFLPNKAEFVLKAQVLSTKMDTCLRISVRGSIYDTGPGSTTAVVAGPATVPLRLE
jgi:hypothetical protein